MTKEEFSQWAEKTCRYCYDKAVSGEMNLHFCAFQSKPLIDKQPGLLILGLNPHSFGTFWDGENLPSYGKVKDAFCEEETAFHTKNDWFIWQGLKRVFRAGNIEYMLEDDYPYMFMNILYFCTESISAFKRDCDRQGEVFNACADLTGEPIQLLRPERILCLSIPDCFNRLQKRFTARRTLIPSLLATAQWDDMPVYGIRHTSCRNKRGEGLTGKALQYLFDHPAASTDEFQQAFAEEIKLFKQ
ncbi:MAG: hypothetical protein LBU37_15675 [Tannerellaceae bacterium]|jgi:hypothetical protein|nr:hypothetical protein [Tannerellaceae bacterium]